MLEDAFARARFAIERIADAVIERKPDLCRPSIQEQNAALTGGVKSHQVSCSPKTYRDPMLEGRSEDDRGSGGGLITSRPLSEGPFFSCSVRSRIALMINFWRISASASQNDSFSPSIFER